MTYTYCSTLTEKQLRNVYADELARMKRFEKGSEEYKAARDLKQEAREELIGRGLTP